MDNRVLRAGLAVAASVVAAPALADAPDTAGLLLQWTFDPLAIIAAFAIGWAYLRGLNRVYQRGTPYADWRPMAFFGGLGAMLLVMISPLNWVAQHMYWIDHVKIMFLRVVGPMFIFLSEPQHEVYMGTPKRLRREVIAPLLRNAQLAAITNRLTKPLVITPLFIAIFYLWQAPPLQDAAVNSGIVGYLMTLSLMLTGIAFFSVIFDRRDAPEGPRHGERVMMLIVTALSSILMGVTFTLKPMVIFSAYGVGPHMFGMTALDDEAAGGFLNWALVSMILLVCIMFVITNWNRAEVRRWAKLRSFDGSNSAALAVPETAEELWLLVGPMNKRLGWSLAIIPIVMMCMAIGTVMTVHYVPWGCVLHTGVCR
jgi:putative membrane protein